MANQKIQLKSVNGNKLQYASWGCGEMDRFFTQKTCDRCGAELKVRRMSRFNTDVLCPACIEEERMHPDYEKAAAAELEAVRRGDMNFPGIGWPGKNGRVR